MFHITFEKVTLVYKLRQVFWVWSLEATKVDEKSKRNYEYFRSVMPGNRSRVNQYHFVGVLSVLVNLYRY